VLEARARPIRQRLLRGVRVVCRSGRRFVEPVRFGLDQGLAAAQRRHPNGLRIPFTAIRTGCGQRRTS
jgi:hypothetical protein